MLNFLSEENYEIHKGFLKTLKLKYSIFEKNELSNKNHNSSNTLRQKYKTSEKRELADLYCDIVLHEIFFDSFVDKTFIPSSLISEIYGSEAAFLNTLFYECMNTKIGFVCVFCIEKNIKISKHCDKYTLVKRGLPSLAVDVSEHAYFLDYGFDKERYLRASLPHLDLGKLY